MRHLRCSTTLCVPSVGGKRICATAPPARHSCALTRRSLIAWTDASGADRWLAAFLIDAAGSGWYTRGQTPQWFWDQLPPRGDHQIGVQEAFAVLLLFATFRVTLADSVVTVYVDKSGVIHSYGYGGSQAPDTHALITVCWLQCALHQVSDGVYRVESGCV